MAPTLVLCLASAQTNHTEVFETCTCEFFKLRTQYVELEEENCTIFQSSFILAIAVVARYEARHRQAIRTEQPLSKKRSWYTTSKQQWKKLLLPYTHWARIFFSNPTFEFLSNKFFSRKMFGLNYRELSKIIIKPIVDKNPNAIRTNDSASM